MITNAMINDKFAEVKRVQDEYKEMYKAALKEQLRLYKLDSDVLRKTDNNRGRLIVTAHGSSLKSPFTIVFHPYKANGELSKKTSVMDIPVELSYTLMDFVEKIATKFEKYDIRKE